MPAPALAVAEDLADLIDGPDPGGQQPLHGELGGGLEIERKPVGMARAMPAGGEAVQGGVADRGAGGDGGLDLKHPALGKEGPDGREHPGPGAQGRGAALGRQASGPVTP